MRILEHWGARLGEQKYVVYARAFCSWWLSELVALVPVRLATFFFDPDNRMFIRATPAGLCLVEPGALTGLTVYDGDPTPHELSDRLRGCDEVVLLLSNARVLRRTISLPVAAKSNLGSAISFQIERQTPFKLDRARYAYRVLQRKNNNNKVDVELAVTSNEEVDTIQGRLSTRGIPINSIRIEGDSTSPPLEFITHQTPRRNSWTTKPWRLLAVLSLLVISIGPPVVAYFVHQRAEQLSAAAVAAAKSARAAEELRSKLRIASTSAELLRVMLSTPKAIEMIAAVSSALPSDSWLFTLQMDEHMLRLVGYSKDVPTMIERLRTIPSLTPIRLSSPIIHDVQKSRDRFELVLPLRRDGDETLTSH